MNNFEYNRAASLDEALLLLDQHANARILAGGTDLLPLMKDDIAAPRTIVDIAHLQDLGFIEEREDGLHIGALATLSSLAENERMRSHYGALADACRLSAAPQLRNMGTIGGNLLQQTRCWYFRGPFNCWMKGGQWCYARSGENELHSVFVSPPEVSPCVSAHPSDPGAALIALGATVHFRSAAGNQAMPIEQFFARPDSARRSYTVLPQGAIITEITVPAPPASARSVYRKAMVRATWSFALAGVALYLEIEDGHIGKARVALSGVAPIPVRTQDVEATLERAAVSALPHDELLAAIVKNAEPLAKNHYKLTLLQSLLDEALGQILA